MPQLSRVMILKLRFLALGFALLTCRAEASPRLISTSPQLTELLFQLGKGADIVATSLMSNYPPAAKSIPLIGTSLSPGAERMAVFKPDWVLFDSAAYNPSVSRASEILGARQYRQDSLSPQTIVAKAARLLREIYQEEASPRLGQYEKCLKLVPSPPESFRFLAFAWLSPPILFGRTTFLQSLIRDLGGISLMPETWLVEYPQVNEEWLIRQPVDAIYYSTEDPEARSITEIATHWWPERKIQFHPLAPAYFGRATFTPFSHLSAINPRLSYRKLEECLASIQ